MKNIIFGLFAFLYFNFSFAFDLPIILGGSYKEKWAQIDNNFYIDTNSIKRNKMGIASAVFKKELREQARLTDGAYYLYTAFLIDFDCDRNEYKIKAIYDILDYGSTKELKVSGLGIWRPINAEKKHWQQGLARACAQ